MHHYIAKLQVQGIILTREAQFLIYSIIVIRTSGYFFTQVLDNQQLILCLPGLLHIVTWVLFLLEVLYVVLVHSFLVCLHSPTHNQEHMHVGATHLNACVHTLTHIFCIIHMLTRLFHLLIANGQQHGDLRLMNGFLHSQTSGRLEIFDANTNQWGTICDEGFTQFSADTACKQLGSERAERFGPAVNLG